MEAKTVKDIITEIRSRGFVVSLPNARSYINEAVNTLTTMFDTAFAPSEIAVKGAIGGSEYPLDTLGVVSVKRDDRPYTAFTASATGITFAHDGDYVVTAIMYPDNVEGEDDDIPLHTAYHQAVLQYVLQKVNPEAEDLFLPMAQAAHRRLKRIKRRGSRIPVRVWR